MPTSQLENRASAKCRFGRVYMTSRDVEGRWLDIHHAFDGRTVAERVSETTAVDPAWTGRHRRWPLYVFAGAHEERHEGVIRAWRH
jgi:hypothetical protein